MANDRLVNGHMYDGAGVCIYCDKCQDAECCPQGQCDRHILNSVMKTAQEFLNAKRLERK